MSNKIVWIFVGDRSVGSSRIHGYKIHDKLKNLGYDSHILYEPHGWDNAYRITGAEKPLIKSMNKGDVFVLQKIKTVDFIPLLQDLQMKGVKTVFVDSDLPVPLYYKQYLYLIIVPSDQLNFAYKANGFTAVRTLHDSPEAFCINLEKQFNKKCVWYGQASGHKWSEALYITNLLDKLNTDWEIETISNTPDATHIWNNNSFIQIASFDATLIPILNLHTQEAKVKSSNRVLQSMALGVPVIAHPIPAYEQVILHGENGFLVRNEEDWKKYLTKLEDPEVRMRIRENGLKTAKQYSLDTYIHQWVSQLGLTKSNNQKNDSKINNVTKKILKQQALNGNYYAKTNYLQQEKNILHKTGFYISYLTHRSGTKANNILKRLTLPKNA